MIKNEFYNVICKNMDKNSTFYANIKFLVNKELNRYDKASGDSFYLLTTDCKYGLHIQFIAGQNNEIGTIKYSQNSIVIKGKYDVVIKKITDPNMIGYKFRGRIYMYDGYLNGYLNNCVNDCINYRINAAIKS